MNYNLFEIREIITIVMAQISSLEEYEFFENNMEGELYLPKYIEDKILKLNLDIYDDLMDNCLNIAKEVKELKSGELNELNLLHREIAFLAEEKLQNYIK